MKHHSNEVRFSSHFDKFLYPNEIVQLIILGDIQIKIYSKECEKSVILTVRK